MQNPFIPLSNANISIVDGRVSEIIVTKLEKLNIKVIRSIKCEGVQESISYHPDIVMHPINHKTIIVAPNVYDYYEERLFGLGINLIKGETILGRKYPDDISYNVGRLGNTAIHNFKYTDEKLVFYLKKENLNFLNVNQGYSKCSLAVIDETSGITSDDFMYRKLIESGYNMLLIRPGYIKLEGEKYGFIGGTSGNISNRKIVFSGTFKHHPDYNKIVKYINNRKQSIIYLSKESIIDIGTIINLYSKNVKII